MASGEGLAATKIIAARKKRVIIRRTNTPTIIRSLGSEFSSTNLQYRKSVFDTLYGGKPVQTYTLLRTGNQSVSQRNASLSCSWTMF